MGMNHYRMQEIESRQKDPAGYADYMATYGCHFSKRMCEWAVSMMMVEEKQSNGNTKKKRLEPWGKEKTDEILLNYGIELQNDKGYDKVFVINMGRADYYGESVPDEAHLAMFVKNYLDDPDGYEEIAFNRFMMDCMSRDVPIMWEDMM